MAGPDHHAACWPTLLIALAGCHSVFGVDPIITEPIDPLAWAVVAAGTAHTCGVRNDGTLVCWGDNLVGQTGVGTDDVEVVTATAIGDGWRTVAATSDHTCGLSVDDTLWCWGAGSDGQLGDGSGLARRVPQQIGNERWMTIATGGRHTCAIRDDASLWCWGSNAAGQLGDATFDARPTPAPVAVGTAFRAVTAGDAHTCAIDTDARLWCWGANTRGQLGIGSTIVGYADQPSPLVVDESSWTSVAAGARHTCGIAEGRIRCWGSNGHGQLGDGERGDRSYPLLPVGDRADWETVFAGGDHACAAASDGAFSCWGENIRGELSNTFGALITQPRPFGFGDNEGEWRTIALGGYHSCAIDRDQHLWCQGDLAYGQLGDGRGGSRRVPTAVTDGFAIFARGAVSCSHDRAGTLRCWGDNERGQLAEGSLIASQAPIVAAAEVQLTDDLTPLARIAIGTQHACALGLTVVPTPTPTTETSLWCWGDNTWGQLNRTLGVPFTSTPTTNLTFVSPVRAVAAADHTCIVGADFGMYCWGRNTAGQLGRGTQDAVAHPEYLRVGVGSDWASVTAGTDHTCGMRNTNPVNHIECWGSNTSGQLGVGTMTASLEPTPLPGAWRSVVAGAHHTCAIATDTTLWCWGANEAGQLGDGTQTSRTVPTQIGTAAWLQVAPGTDHTCGVGLDGSLACWGNNERGQLGDGTTLSRLAPTQVGTDPRWLRVATGDRHTCATRRDIDQDSVWCWGSALLGQVGDGMAWHAGLIPIE